MSGKARVSLRWQVRLKIAFLVALSVFCGLGWGSVAGDLSHQVWAGVAVGVVVGTGVAFLVFSWTMPVPWSCWTVTVWFCDGHKAHYRMARLSSAQKMQRLAVRMGKRDGVAVQARISKGRRGL